MACTLKKQRPQATGNVETSNSTQAPAAGRNLLNNQTQANRPSQLQVEVEGHGTNSYIRGTGGTVLLSHLWRHTQHPGKEPQNTGPGSDLTANFLKGHTRRPAGRRSCDETRPVELGQAASNQPPHIPGHRLGAPGRALHCNEQGKSIASQLAEKPRACAATGSVWSGDSAALWLGGCCTTRTATHALPNSPVDC
jgi:hypothetical protein